MERAVDRPNKYEAAMVISLIVRMPLKVHRRWNFGILDSWTSVFKLKKNFKERG